MKKKLNSLRTYYNKEKRKVQASKKSGTGTEELYISKWTYYDALDEFLKHQVLPRKTVSNMVSITHLTVFIFLYKWQVFRLVIKKPFKFFL